MGPRIVHMMFSKAGICDPHNLLELPELCKETGQSIVDLLSVRGDYQSS